MITLICGLPNAGKTTYSEQFSPVVHLDDCEQPKQMTFESIVADAEGDIYAEGVCNSRSSRGMFLDAVKHKDEKKVCIWLDTPLDVCLERERNYRQRPEGMVVEHARRFEEPSFDEGWDEIIRIRYECNHTEKQT